MIKVYYWGLMMIIIEVSIFIHSLEQKELSVYHLSSDGIPPPPLHI